MTLLRFLVVLSFANRICHEKFYKMVKDNIEAAENYVTPTQNLEVLNVKDNVVHEFGNYDFIIVGAGAAGCVLANRLSENESWKILLLEAGGEQNEFSKIPGLAPNLTSSPMNWGYSSAPQTTACFGWPNNSCVADRGKVLGGSSTINYKMYVRGNRNDYDKWAAMGNTGWSYEEVLPYFIQMENSHIWNREEGYHGHSGELDVNYAEPSPWTKVHIDAMKELGLKVVDYNGESQIGTSQVQFNMRDIKSLGGAMAFIDPIRCVRKNLEIEINAFVTKVLINKSQKTASGVEFVKNGKRYAAYARKEVILSAGAFNTPQILMLSGIGPHEELDRHGIETFLDLPVGKNLEDHFLFTGFIFKTNLTAYNDSLSSLLKSYLQGHRPLTAAGLLDTCSFLNTIDENSSQPDLQVNTGVSPGVTLFGQLKNNFAQIYGENYDPHSDVFFYVEPTNPKSKGTVTLQSKNPADFPVINYGYLSDPEGADLDTLYRSVVKLQTLLDTKAYRAVNATLAHTISGCDDYEEYSREWWYCAFRIYSASGYHPTGTARMGVSTEDSVVNPLLFVHKMDKLRVVDSSVMPKVPSGNTAAPTYMIANKISVAIKEHYSAHEN